MNTLKITKADLNEHGEGRLAMTDRKGEQGISLRRCDTCEYWRRDEDHPTTGLCLFPEAMVPFWMVPEVGYGPITCDDDGARCGAWVAQER